MFNKIFFLLFFIAITINSEIFKESYIEKENNVFEISTSVKISIPAFNYDYGKKTADKRALLKVFMICAQKHKTKIKSSITYKFFESETIKKIPTESGLIMKLIESIETKIKNGYFFITALIECTQKEENLDDVQQTLDIIEKNLLKIYSQKDDNIKTIEYFKKTEKKIKNNFFIKNLEQLNKHLSNIIENQKKIIKKLKIKIIILENKNKELLARINSLYDAATKDELRPMIYVPLHQNLKYYLGNKIFRGYSKDIIFTTDGAKFNGKSSVFEIPTINKKLDTYTYSVSVKFDPKNDFSPNLLGAMPIKDDTPELLVKAYIPKTESTEWLKITKVKDKKGILRTYINGELKEVKIIGTKTKQAFNINTIGRHNNKYFKGKIKDIYIFKEALNKKLIKKLIK